MYLPIKASNGIVKFLLGRHGNKAKATRAPSVLVTDDSCIHYFAILTEHLLQTCIINTPGKIADVGFGPGLELPHPSLWPASSGRSLVYSQSPPLCILVVAKQKNSFTE